MCRASCPHRVFLFGSGCVAAPERRTGRGRRRPRGRELRLASALSVHTACGLFAIKSGNINDVQVGSRRTREAAIAPRATRPGAPGRRPGAPREQRRERRESQTNDMSSTSCDLCVPAHGWASGPPVRRRATGAAASATRRLRTLGLHIGNALTTDIGTALTTDIPRSTAPPRPRRAPSTPQSEVI